MKWNKFVAEMFLAVILMSVLHLHYLWCLCQMDYLFIQKYKANTVLML
jgi:hypothetical protein